MFVLRHDLSSFVEMKISEIVAIVQQTEYKHKFRSIIDFVSAAVFQQLCERKNMQTFAIKITERKNVINGFLITTIQFFLGTDTGTSFWIQAHLPLDTSTSLRSICSHYVQILYRTD